MLLAEIIYTLYAWLHSDNVQRAAWMKTGSHLPIKIVAGYFNSEAVPGKRIEPLFPHLKAINLSTQKLFLPLCHTDGTTDNFLPPQPPLPYYQHSMQSGKQLIHVTL